MSDDEGFRDAVSVEGVGDRVIQLVERVELLKQESESLEAKLQAERQEKEEQAERGDIMEGKVSELIDDLDKSDADLKAAKEDAVAAAAAAAQDASRREQLEKQQTESENKIEKLENDAVLRAKENEKLAADLKDNDENLEILNNKLTETQAELEAAERKVASAATATASPGGDAKAQDAEASAKTIADLEKKVKSLQADLDAASKKEANAAPAAPAAAAQSKGDAAPAKVAELEAKVNTLQEASNKAQESNKTLTSDLAKAKETEKTLRKELKAAKAETAKAQDAATWLQTTAEATTTPPEEKDVTSDIDQEALQQKAQWAAALLLAERVANLEEIHEEQCRMYRRQIMQLEAELSQAESLYFYAARSNTLLLPLDTSRPPAELEGDGAVAAAAVDPHSTLPAKGTSGHEATTEQLNGAVTILNSKSAEIQSRMSQLVADEEKMTMQQARLKGKEKKLSDWATRLEQENSNFSETVQKLEQQLLAREKSLEKQQEANTTGRSQLEADRILFDKMKHRHEDEITATKIRLSREEEKLMQQFALSLEANANQVPTTANGGSTSGAASAAAAGSGGSGSMLAQNPAGVASQLESLIQGYDKSIHGLHVKKIAAEGQRQFLLSRSRSKKEAE